MSWLQIKNPAVLKCHLLLFYPTTMNHFSIELWCVTKSGCYMTTGKDQLSGWTEKKLQSISQSQICTPKSHGYWWSAAHLNHVSFLNPGKTITSEKCAQQINEMHWKMQCLQLALVSRKGPIFLHNNAWLHVVHPILHKLTKLGSEVCLIHHIHLTSQEPIITSSSILTFYRENASTTSRRQKTLSMHLSYPKAQIFTL